MAAKPAKEFTQAISVYIPEVEAIEQVLLQMPSENGMIIHALTQVRVYKETTARGLCQLMRSKPQNWEEHALCYRKRVHPSASLSLSLFVI
jgi:hypothetical protein